MIDEFSIAVNPVFLGMGRMMFESIKEMLTQKQTKTRTFSTGKVYPCHEPMA